MKTIDLHQWEDMFIAAADAIAMQEKRLNELDSLIGDGDHGSSIRRGFDAVRSCVLESSFTSVGELFTRVGSVLLQDIGGAIGPLIGSFYLTAGKPAKDLSEIDLTTWSLMFTSGIDRVQRLGKAQPGDKTMLDALQPASKAFKDASDLDLPVRMAFRNAASAARQGADMTSSMIAKFGRAKFVGERSLGYQDPGANSIFIILDAMAEALTRLAPTGDLDVQESDTTLLFGRDYIQVKVHKQEVLLEISSPMSVQILKQAQPLTFFLTEDEPVRLVKISHWHLEDHQLILTCETQREHLQAYLLIEFPSTQSCQISLCGLPDSFRQCSVKFSSTEDENFFGGGEQFSTVNQRGKRFDCWADDRGFQQQPDHPWTYWPVPFFISNLGYSFFLKNTEKSHFDLCASVLDEFEVLTDTPNLSFVIAWADQPVDHIRLLFQRTGFPPLPPKWNNGVWVTCLGGQEEVLEKAHFLRREHIPCSALWVYDAHDPKGNIGWPICPMHHSGNYQDIPGMVDELHRMGFKVQTYLFPYFYASSLLYSEADEKGYFLKNADGSTYQFPFWRAVGREMVQVPASILDFTNPEAKEWWQGLIRYILVDLGFDGWMHDFAENIPDRVVAFNGLSGAALHNLYPLLYQQAAREACLQVKPDASFYARSGYSGSHAWLTAAWPGDQICTWEKNEGLSSAVTACLSLSLSGMFFIGPDIGGYFSRGLPQESNSFSKELWIRWTQFGALSSIMRDHLTDKPEGAVELWTDAETLATFKQYAWLHMSLSPYLQGCAAQSIKSGRPMMQHMFLVEPNNRNFWNCDDQYLFGDALLVAPILQDGQRTRPVELPGGKWINYWDGKVHEGGQQVNVPAPLDQIPVLVKECTVLPTLLDPADTVVGSSMDSVKVATDNLKLQVYIPVDWHTQEGTAQRSHRELADGTIIDFDWSSNIVGMKVRSAQTRRYLIVIPALEKPAHCIVNGQAVAVYESASENVNSCWYDSQSEFIHILCEVSDLDLRISY